MELVALCCGVIGGVGEITEGNVWPPTGFAAATLGRFETTGVGLLMIVFGPGGNDANVATDDAEFVLVGDGGRIECGSGLGDGIMPVEEGCFSSDGTVEAFGV